MVKIDKTPLPDEVRIKNEKDYRSGLIFELHIKKDTDMFKIFSETLS